MTKKTIVFDFDGVLADAKDEFLNALNFSLERLNLPQITLEEFNNKSKWGLLNERNYSKLKLFMLVRHAKKYMKRNTHHIKCFEEVLKTISELEENCIIVSSNSVNNIKKILGSRTQFFSKIYGNQGIMGKVKTLKKLNNNSIYFTDEVRDIIQCQKVGMTVIAVTWGFDPQHELEKFKPYKIISQPDEIKTIITNLES